MKKVIIVIILLLTSLIMLTVGMLGSFSSDIKILILLVFYIVNMIVTLIIRDIYNKNKE